MSILFTIKKAWKWRWALRSLPSTVFFNFHYLPFKQAVKLPIILYKPKLKSLRGEVRIEGEVRTAQIVLGENIVSLYPNDGIMFENHGGCVIFRGSCTIGNASKISIGPKGVLTIGNRTCASAALKIACYKEITLHHRVRCGWDVTLFDCDFHKLTRLEGGYTNPYRRIELNENCWLGYGCTVLKGTELPPYTIVSAKTVLNKKYDIPPYCVIGTDNTVKIKKEGIYRNLDDDEMD